MQRESCPFHDLRADGCFQPEYQGQGVGGHVIDPMRLSKRPDGNRLHFGLPGQLAIYGLGGEAIPLDVDASGKPPKAARECSSRPWTSTGKPNNGFPPRSPATNEAAVAPPQEAPPAPPPFRSGGKGSWKAAIPYVPVGVLRPPTARVSRFTTGVVHPTVDPRLSFVPPRSESTKRSKSPPKRAASASVRSARPVFDVRKPLHGTFGFYPAHMPEPESSGATEWRRRPIFTYHTQSKRSMPIVAPWTTGLATAAPAPLGGPSSLEIDRASAPASRGRS
jgi:hypothetical protein